MKSATLSILLLALSPLGAAAETGTLEKIKESGRISIGYQDASIPFSYLDGAQKPVGYALDICAKIVEAVKDELKLPTLKVEYLSVTSATRIPLTVNGTIDMNCASATNTADRQNQVAFVNSHFLSAAYFAAKKSANLKTLKDLRGKTVGAVAGSTNLLDLNKANADLGLGVTVAIPKDQLEGFLMLDTDRVQAYVGDDVQLAVAIARSKDPSQYAISEEPFSRALPFGIIIRKDDAPFKALADKVTAALYASPEIEKIYAKWFQSPVPPNGINFNYPMPAALRKSFAKPSSSADPAAYE